MNRVLIILISTVIVVGSTVRSSAAESETFMGTATRSGTFKRPLPAYRKPPTEPCRDKPFGIRCCQGNGCPE